MVFGEALQIDHAAAVRAVTDLALAVMNDVGLETLTAESFAALRSSVK
jgi:hypothetical protein